jgi:hypothetical protein
MSPTPKANAFCAMCGGTGGWPDATGRGWVICQPCRGGVVEEPATAEQLAHFCAVHLDVDQGELLQREIVKICNRYEINLATQLMALGGILGELEALVPHKGLVAPTIALLIRNHTHVAARLDAMPTGHA